MLQVRLLESICDLMTDVFLFRDGNRTLDCWQAVQNFNAAIAKAEKVGWGGRVLRGLRLTRSIFTTGLSALYISVVYKVPLYSLMATPA